MSTLKLGPIPDYGDVMTLAEFQEAVDSGSFIDYDGFGHYATETQMSNVVVRPSEAKGGVPEPFTTLFSHIVWFNR